MQTTNNLGLKKPGAEDVVNIEDLNSNSDALDGKFGASSGHGHTGDAGDGPKIESGGLAAGAATDTVIGSRTVSDTTAPTGDSGTPTTLFGWLANMIKAITGGATWRTLPGMTIAAIKTILDAATNAGTASTLMKRDASGRAQVAAPSAAADIARKDTVDAVQSSLNTHAAVGSAAHGATSAPTISTLMARDSAGRAQVVAPSVAADIANKGYVDTAVSGATIPDASLTVKGKVQLSSATNSTSEVLAATPSAVKAAYDRAEAAFTSASNGKTAIATAITGMGQATSSNDTFTQLAAKIADISKDATATPGEVLYGKTIYQGGVKKTGTMPNRSGSTNSTGTAQWPNGDLAIYPQAGYYGGLGVGEVRVPVSQLQAADGDLAAGNIRSDKAIFGVQGSIPVFSGGHYVTPEFTTWDGAVFFRPNGAGGSGQMLFEGDSWVRGNEPNLLSSNIRKGTSIFGKAGTMVEGPNLGPDTVFMSMGYNTVPVPNSGGMYYYLDFYSNMGTLSIVRSYYNSAGVFQYREPLVSVDYTAGLRLYRDTFVTNQYWSSWGDIYDDGGYDRARIRTYNYNGVLLADTGTISISYSGRYPSIWSHHVTSQGIIVSAYPYANNIYAWARNGVLLMDMPMSINVYVRGQGSSNYSDRRMASWFQVSESKLFVNLQVGSGSGHNDGVAEITLGTDGLSASGTYRTWSSSYPSEVFFMTILSFAKRYFS